MQVLQYEEIAGTWSEIGKTERARKYHGVVEIDSALLCSGIVGQTNKSKLLSLNTITTIVYHLINFFLSTYLLFLVVSLLASFNYKWYLNDFKVHIYHEYIESNIELNKNM